MKLNIRDIVVYVVNYRTTDGFGKEGVNSQHSIGVISEIITNYDNDETDPVYLVNGQRLTLGNIISKLVQEKV